MDKNDELLSQIDRRVRGSRRWGIYDFLVAKASYWAAIVASFLATIAVSTGRSGTVVAIVAAVPGVVIIIDRTFHFADRAAWHWRYVALAKAIGRKLRFEGVTLAQVSRAFSELEIEMEKVRPSMDLSAIREATEDEDDEERDGSGNGDA
jgi:hypothetical protein